MFTDTNVTLTTVRSELTDEQARVQWHSDLLAKIKPWYKKWKHDSKRSFLKVLFAAGKAKKPDFAEPNIDTLMPPDAAGCSGGHDQAQRYLDAAIDPQFEAVTVTKGGGRFRSYSCRGLVVPHLAISNTPALSK